METLAEKVRCEKPDLLFVLSPHAPFGNGLMFVDAETFTGGLRQFGVPDLFFTAQGNAEAVQKLSAFLADSIRLGTWKTSAFDLDHASVVPLTWFAEIWGQLPPLLLANPIGLDLESAYELGKRLARFEDPRRWALLASGDLSHRVTPGAPAGYHPDGRRFDEIVINALSQCDASAILQLDPAMIDRAGECGLRSALALLGLAGRGPIDVLSYEAPFGVGYGTAFWKKAERSGLPHLAREAVLFYLKTGKRLPLEQARQIAPDPEIWTERKACFVSLKERRSGSLRGCIGTLEPTCPSLGEEIIRNAIASASQDPRFDPVSLTELQDLVFSVDVLERPERVSAPESLDPKRFGVIVEKGNRRGVLLPDLEGVDTVEEQLFIASRKAGLPGPEGADLWRFTVKRIREQDER
jgi:AmmeMemoRadiSam system protein A